MSIARLSTAAGALWHSQPRFRTLVQVAGALVFVAVMFPPSCSPSSPAGGGFATSPGGNVQGGGFGSSLGGSSLGGGGATAAPSALVPLQLAPVHVKPGMALDQVQIAPAEPDNFAKPKATKGK